MTVGPELAEHGPPEPWTSPGAAPRRPPRLLLTLVGDYWWQRTEPLPSAAILDDGARRIFSFGAASQPWDGMWSLVAFPSPRTTGPPGTRCANSCSDAASPRSERSDQLMR